jgi:hypothetical protein
MNKMSKNLLAQHNSTKWWKTINSLTTKNSSHSGIPPIKYNGIIYDDDLEKATVFNHYFSSQSQVDESSSCLPNFSDSVPNNYFNK